MEKCHANGIKLLREDLRFLRICLAKLPRTSKLPVIRRYLDIWATRVAGSSSDVAKDNHGRFAANSWLREYTSAYIHAGGYGQED